MIYLNKTMRRKNKPQPIISDLAITAVAAEGNAIGRTADGMAVFVPYAAPGDVADVKILKKRKSYAQGVVESFKALSAERVQPPCSHFGVCGGCKWQHLPYPVQLHWKQQQVQDALDRIAKVPYPEIRPIIGSDGIYGYRNKLEYTFSNKKWLTYEQLSSDEVFDDRDGVGFHIPGAFDKVLDISQCLLQEEFSNQLRDFVKAYAKEHSLSFYDIRAKKGLLRTLMVRTASTGQKMAVMVFGEEDEIEIKNLLEAIKKRFSEISSLHYVVNTKVNDSIADQEVKLYCGKEWIDEEMEGLRFRVGPKSFYQTNSAQAYKLYSVARDFANLKGDELVYDLYTGAGTIACFVARNCKKVIGIEYVPEAIADAKLNAQDNGLVNTEFYAGDMKDVLTDDFISHHGQPEVIIVDPPRAGMHQDVVDVILRAKPKTIVYVSCNPATQARDVALLAQDYEIAAVQPVDMFPHTAHVENVIKLVRK